MAQILQRKISARVMELGIDVCKNIVGLEEQRDKSGNKIIFRNVE